MLSALAALWLVVLLRLSREWALNATFHFAWVVPILVLILVHHRRWESCPNSAQEIGLRSRFFVIAGLVLLAALVLPLRVLSEANPAWRLVQWLLVITACAITLLSVYLVGGRRWAVHLGLPVLLMLLVVPLPSKLDASVVRSLSSVNARVSVEALNLAGIPVVLKGENVLHLARGQVRIDDACSGIRSLHLAIALGFFWGALYRIRWLKRGMLVVSALGVALLANLSRNLVLAMICQRNGSEAMERWHNLVGIAAQVILLGVLWTLVVVMNRSAQGSERVAPKAVPPIGVRTQHQAPRRALAMAAILFGLACFGTVEGLNEWWYRSRGAPMQERPDWQVAIPTGDGFQEYAISARSKAILRPDEHRGFFWQNAKVGSGLFFYLHWKPGSNAAQHAQVHRPEVCLPAAGLRQLRSTVDIPLRVAHQAFTFKGYEFEDRGQPVFVFHGIWDDQVLPLGHEADGLGENWSASSRVRAAWFGRRQSGQRVLEAVLWEAGDLDTASARFQELLDDVIQVDGHPTKRKPRTLAQR